MTDVTLLGPQRPTANLPAALEALGIDGRLCVITAGWQEREGELDELREQMPQPIVDLRLYARCEEAFAEDRGLFEAHRERQDTLIALQRFYRVRLTHGLAAARDLATAEGPAIPLAAQRRAATSALRSLDRHHLVHIRREHAAFRERYPVAACAALRRQREAVTGEVEHSQAVLIAGGHVAVLLSRLRLLDLAGLLSGKPVIAWSAGAMAISDRVVLFHDHPPQGAGDPEVLEAGLGLAPGVVALPHARARLRLDDAHRVSLFARRFSPALALTFDSGSALRMHGAQVTHLSGVSRLTASGRVELARAA